MCRTAVRLEICYGESSIAPSAWSCVHKRSLLRPSWASRTARRENGGLGPKTLQYHERIGPMCDNRSRGSPAMAGGSMYPAKQAAVDWIDRNRERLSDFDLEIWGYAEPAWREYKSAKAYVDLLRADGWEVEEGSGGMPTAFAATWSN